MTIVLLLVCFTVVFWSAAMCFSFLGINAEYIYSSSLRMKFI